MDPSTVPLPPVITVAAPEEPEYVVRASGRRKGHPGVVEILVFKDRLEYRATISPDPPDEPPTHEAYLRLIRNGPAVELLVKGVLGLINNIANNVDLHLQAFEGETKQVSISGQGPEGGN